MKRSLVVFAILCAVAVTIEADIYKLPISVPHWYGSKTIMVNIRILEPSGIEAWTSDTSSIDMLKINCYRMSHFIFNEIKWEPVFDENSTTLQDGEFKIIKYDLVTKNYETIECTAAVRKEFDMFYSDNRFKWNPGVITDTSKDLSVLENNINACIASQPTKFLFFPIENATTYVTDHKKFVEYRLFNVDDLMPLVYNVADTYVVQDGVVAKMKTVTDKCRVLEIVKGVLDYDQSQGSPKSTQNAKDAVKNKTENKEQDKTETVEKITNTTTESYSYETTPDDILETAEI